MSDYKMRIAIDFGSTVSALAWNLWERETPNGDFALVKNAGWKMQFPTLIAKKSQNPDVPLKGSTVVGKLCVSAFNEITLLMSFI